MEVKINRITRLESGTCLDNYLSNIPGSYAVSTIAVSDHQAITAIVKTITGEKKVKETYTYREMKEYNWMVFKFGINNLTLRGVDTEAKWNCIISDIKEVVENSFPLRQTKQKFYFTMSQGLLKSRDKKNDLLKKYKQGKIDKKIYIDYNNCYRKIIRTEHSKNFTENMAKAGSNGKKKWKVIKEGLQLSKENVKITEINSNGNNFTTDENISLAFKTHFETCASKLAVGFPQGTDTCTVMPQGEKWGFKHTTELEISAIIKNLANKNSSGPDLLSNKMLKMERYAFAKLLKPLINESLDRGLFPSMLKTANVIPVFKKGDKTNLNNYRPISLLPVISKVFEKILNAQLTKIIDNGYIDDNQYGFRLAHSTEDAVLKFVDKIEQDLALGKHVATVYIDVSKAFDSCDHKILLKKIGRTGLDENGIKLMESYLKNRSQIVIVNRKEGGCFVINIGVPQGSVLGPTLFKIYIMDLHYHTDLFCMKFADDSSFEGVGKNKDELERVMNMEMAKISKWFINNKLTLHPDKSRFIIHSRDKLIKISLDGKEIKRCGYGLQEESVGLLGLQIDENLDWKVHIKKVENKISKGNYLLWRHGKKMDVKLKKVIYESFIRCHLLYCLPIWGGAKQIVLKQLNKLLHKSWSKIGGKKIHTLNRLEKYQILKLEDELAIQESKILWKWDNGKIPQGLKDIITERADGLRGRRFNLMRGGKQNSINWRLSSRANKSIQIISKSTSTKSLSTAMQKQLFNVKYKFRCVTRNCFVCKVG